MRSILVWSLLLAACEVQTASGQEDAARYHPDAVAAELRNLQQELRSGQSSQALRSLPAAWQVATPQGVASISTQPLRKYLEASEQDSAVMWLDHAAEELEGWQREEGRPEEARTKLAAILARREFARGGPPGLLELLRERVLGWIRRMIGKLMDLIALHPGASRALFWTLVAAAAGILALWLIRLGKRDGTFMTLAPPDGALPLRAWEEWIAAARAAAEEGDLRQAIHCSYWAGVARLQQTGALSTERTFTPREYLRLARSSGPAEHLNALTGSLESFWYADRKASPDDFRESLRHLEGLGCKVT